MTIPKWLIHQLKPEDVEQIEKSIAEAEATTSGEIVPMIVRRSSTIGHVPPLIFCVLLLFYFIFGLSEWKSELIGTHWAWNLVFLAILVPLSSWVARFGWIQRQLTFQMDREFQTENRAQLEFYEAKLNQTQGATGILLFVSLMEHRVVVLADESISKKMPPETWNEVCTMILEGIRRKNLAEGLSAGIKKCGEILSKEFPIAPDDRNELRDHLILKD